MTSFIRPPIKTVNVEELIAKAPIIIKNTQDEEPKPPTQEGNTEKPNIISASDYWTIKGVDYNGKIRTYDLSKTLIESATQDDIAQLSRSSRENKGFYAGDSRLHYSVFRAVKDADNTEVRDFLKQNLRAKWLMTLTRIKYSPKSKDEVIHNYKQSDEESLKGTIIGADDFFENLPNEAFYELLLGESDVAKIQDVFNFINGTDGYIWRLSEKPKSLDERIVRFDAGSVRLGLDCDRGPSDSYPAFGYREVVGQK